MAIGDKLRITFEWGVTSTSRKCVNHMYFEQAGVLILDEPWEDLWEAVLGSDLWDAYQAVVTQALSLQNVYFGEAPDFESFHILTPSGINGGATGDKMPAHNAFVVNHRTTHLGHSGRGRIFTPPMSESQVTNGLMAGAVFDTLDSSFNAAVADGIGDGVLTASWLPTHWSENDQAFYRITQFLPRARVAAKTLRKKLYE